VLQLGLICGMRRLTAQPSASSAEQTKTANALIDRDQLNMPVDSSRKTPFLHFGRLLAIAPFADFTFSD
jgi:hypothetical protein